MRYRVSFEFDAESEPSDWYWYTLLGSVESNDDKIDWTTFTLEKQAGWTQISVDSI